MIMCALVVEDDNDQRQLYSMMLKLHGYDVRMVSNGKEAMEEIIKSPPDVLLTDISMPVMDGLELIKAIRKNEKVAQMPIVVMTSFGNSYLKAAQNLSANEMLAKPFTPEELYMAIDKVLSNTSGH